MGEEQRPCRSGEDQLRSSGEDDRISGLPDELLHDILVRLRSAHAAARTGVLSRRWRRLWRHLPELVLDVNAGDPLAPPPPAALFLDSVDGALAGYAAPTVDRLGISVSNGHGFRVRPERVAPWLRFAAERVAGELELYVPRTGLLTRWRLKLDLDDDEEVLVLELPACERAESIVLFLAESWRLQLRPAGMFAALTSLYIIRGEMEGSELTALVCTRCPRLRKLSLFLELVDISDLSVRSGTLQSLVFCVQYTGRLEVVAPRLEMVSISHAKEAHISAPKLAVIDWLGDPYDPRRHRFADVGRCLRALKIGQDSVVASLVRQFDEVDELDLEIYIRKGIAGYESFLNETNKLPKCKALRIYLRSKNHHGLAGMLHLLRSCNNTRKLSVLTDPCSTLVLPCPLSCPCRLDESCKIDGIALSSLEEVEINGFTYSHEKLKFVELLSSNAANLKKLVINYTKSSDRPRLIKEVYEKVRSICHPNVKVEFYVFLGDKQVCI